MGKLLVVYIANLEFVVGLQQALEKHVNSPSKYRVINADSTASRPRSKPFPKLRGIAQGYKPRSVKERA